MKILGQTRHVFTTCQLDTLLNRVKNMTVEWLNCEGLIDESDYKLIANDFKVLIDTVNGPGDYSERYVHIVPSDMTVAQLYDGPRLTVIDGDKGKLK